jgi:putative DNA primase/helicase
VHPLRWPGSVHRKGEPKLANIASESDNEIDLAEALDLLRDASGRDKENVASDNLRAANVTDVASALRVIPNEALEWCIWNRIGMATWAAAGGSEDGFKAFAEWSAKSPKNDPDTTRLRWEHYRTSPPSRIGFGTLVYLARKHNPLWTRGRQVVPAQTSISVIAETQEIDNGAITQDGVARVFARRYAERLRFCHDIGKWYEWVGTHWQVDRKAIAFQFVRELAREYSEQSSKTEIKEVRKITFAGGVEKFVRSDRDIAVTSDYWDQDLLLLGTPAGTVDLQTGVLREADPADHITKVTSVGPAMTADCPRWRKFLEETTGNDAELIRFLQQWCGYALTGLTREHALVFVYGPGGNGKSVFLNVITWILKGYAATSSMDTFTASKSDRHLTEIAKLCGARLVTASETEEGRAWAESRLKQLTGGDRISARFMRQDEFEFTPQLKLMIVGNHKPILRNIDDAARRRFFIVPFVRKPDQADPELEQKLMNEAPGILRWMIEGCLDWQESRLSRPQSVVDATESYFENQDVLSQWIADECELDPGTSKNAPIGSLYTAWTAYCERCGETPGSNRAFGDALEKKGCSRGKVQHVRVMTGIRLKKGTSRIEAD